MRPAFHEDLENYRALADGGRLQLWLRLAIGLYIAMGAYWLKPSLVPAIWFVIMVLSQFGSVLFMQRYICAANAKLTPKLAAACTVVMASASVAYTWIAAYLWFCGAAAQVFAITIILGSLLHITLFRNSARPVFFASAGCQCLLLFGLPIISALTVGGVGVAGCVIIVLAGALYLFHLAAAVGQSNRLTTSLKAANRSKSAFLATLSHEIRTPLNAVTSAAHLLDRTDLTAEQREHVSILLTGSEILLSLINDVLDMSKIEAGKLEAEFQDVELRTLVVKLVALWTPRAKERGLSLECEFDDQLPQAIRTDPLRLNQILFNLLSNAVKFTAEGGVRIVVRQFEGPQGQLWARFQVIDSGPGMSQEVQGRLFRSFEQADASVAQRYGGTGLGLAISLRLAELLGGRLGLISAPGEGATFSVEIPLIAAAGEAQTESLCPPEETETEMRSISVLLAEDHPVNRRLVALFLEPTGWSLTMVENGAEAVEAAAARPFDVILLDMQMPVMSGLDAAQAIKAGGGVNAATPIAALTANAFEDQRQQWRRVGAAAFLTKPLNPTLLVETIQDLATHAAAATSSEGAVSGG